MDYVCNLSGIALVPRVGSPNAILDKLVPPRVKIVDGHLAFNYLRTQLRQNLYAHPLGMFRTPKPGSMSEIDLAFLGFFAAVFL
jgi:hypothetical protein